MSSVNFSSEGPDDVRRNAELFKWQRRFASLNEKVVL